MDTHGRCDARVNRAGFVSAAIGAAGVGVALPSLPASRARAASASPEQDTAILNLALQLEDLSAAFYGEAETRLDRPELRLFATVVAAHEREHAELIRSALGAKAVKRPRFEFGDTTKDAAPFGEAAVALEDLTVGALNGQAANLSPDSLRTAARIVSVEARHAGWIRAILGKDPSPNAADRGLTEAQVTAAITATGFVQKG